MNKYQEALEYIFVATNGGDGIVKQMNALAELVEKATANEKKFEHKSYICPVCHSPVRKFHSYCWSCGQYLGSIIHSDKERNHVDE